MTEPDRQDIKSLVIPTCDWVLQWRGDGYWRETHLQLHQEELAGRSTADELDWGKWTGQAAITGRGGSWDGSPTGWSLFGEVPEGGGVDVHVRLTDGTEPTIHHIGWLWACWWHGLPQAASVEVGPRTISLPFTKPH
ncbi:hypothetical protein CLV92_102130 [Kineococcus xinjiangensis]|uniref:Uncharacterized protein n=1 Tax=Kineococcus xinjiangensis TaxID=512762 RepID=A0A2S6IUW9_9ACTN|nr:hypothetical protein [Kineococcus xinjiangensis]PPK97979.1 hypothetical protein CLV92_102130 [Kineococcus xinjiangensis]